MSSITLILNLPDKLLSSVKRLAEARGISVETWIREWVTVGIASEVLPAESEAPPPAAPPAEALKDYNSVSEVAAYLRVSARHLYNVIASGSLGHVKVGTLVRVRRDQVEAYLKDNAKEARKETNHGG